MTHNPKLSQQQDLSQRVRETFQIVALLATVMVVGIHYRSAGIGASVSASTWNELMQEFVFNGVARVAVPLFAFAAGFFYFRSYDGSITCYRKKLVQRCHSVLIPFWITSAIAVLTWVLFRCLEGKPIDVGVGSLALDWLMRPPAEQLWFLRDLMVLVIFAPLIAWSTRQTSVGWILIATLSISWLFDFQIFPILRGWHVLRMETWLFFSLGCLATSQTRHLELLSRISPRAILVGFAAWWALIALRVFVRPDFDLWYVTNYGWPDLLLQRISVVLGCLVLFSFAARIRCALLLELSGGSFFVYLIHEFPIRAIVVRLSDSFLDSATSAWIVTLLVVIGCYTAALILSGCFPRAFAIFTGGRAPQRNESRWAWWSAKAPSVS